MLTLLRAVIGRDLRLAMRRQADQIVVTSRFRFTRDDGLETTLSSSLPGN